MSLNNLHSFITLLESDGSLSRVSVAVDPVLEIAAITNRVCKQPSGGSALLFEQPHGSNFPVATNLFGSEKRVCQALGISNLSELTDRLSTLLDQLSTFEVSMLDRHITALPAFSRYTPKTSPEPDKTVVLMDVPDLTRFPFLHSWPGDGQKTGHGRYITLPQVFTSDPVGGTGNCGMYRVQLRGTSEVAIQWKAGSGAARHAEQYRQLGKIMPVAIVLGGDPATLFSAMFPLPGALDELTFAGFLRGEPLVTAICRTVPLCVPTGAEVVIEAYVDPGASVIEGPFGNHTGCYAPAAPATLMRVTAISHRPAAIIPATVVGPPPMEDCWMALAWERLLLAFVKKLVPAVIDISFPFEWVFHQSAIISLENPRPGMVRNSAAQLWALPWFASSRILLFTSSGTGKTSLGYAAWRAINLTDAPHDVIRDEKTGRIAIDATGCTADRREIAVSDATANLVAHRWKEYRLP